MKSITIAAFVALIILAAPTGTSTPVFESVSAHQQVEQPKTLAESSAIQQFLKTYQAAFTFKYNISQQYPGRVYVVCMADDEPTKDQVVDLIIGVNNALVDAGLINCYFKVTINMNDGRIAADISGDVREANDTPSKEEYFASHVDYYLDYNDAGSIPHWKEYVLAPKIGYVYDDNVSPMENALREANMKKNLLNEYLDQTDFGFNFTYNIKYDGGINPYISMITDDYPSKLQLAKMGIGINGILCNISNGPRSFNIWITNSQNCLRGSMSAIVWGPSYRNTPEYIAGMMLTYAQVEPNDNMGLDDNDTSLVANIMRQRLADAADPNKEQRENLLKIIDKIDDNSSILYAVYDSDIRPDVVEIIVMTKTPMSQSNVTDIVYRLTMASEGELTARRMIVSLDIEFVDTYPKSYAHIMLPTTGIKYDDANDVAQLIMGNIRFEDEYYKSSVRVEKRNFLKQMAANFDKIIK